MSAVLPAVLQEAHTIVAEQLARLRTLAESTRSRSELLTADLRQTQRQLDEVSVQHRLASERRTFTVSTLARRNHELRSRCDALAQEVQATQHALKQLEQLIRQIEMSSGALTGAEENETSDPWVLALKAQVIHGREEERLRLAREVHDGPAQVLANSLMTLETCYGLAQRSELDRVLLMLDRMRGVTRDGLNDVRRFIANLRPARLEEQGLGEAIGEYLRGYADAYNASVSLDADPLPRLPIEAQIVLYRIVQEALQNAHKYARNAPITVRLLHQGNALRLTIRDEGPGFDVHEVARRAGRSSWGLTSMRERAELIGARLSVASRAGHGTEVSVVLPLNQ